MTEKLITAKEAIELYNSPLIPYDDIIILYLNNLIKDAASKKDNYVKLKKPYRAISRDEDEKELKSYCEMLKNAGYINVNYELNIYDHLNASCYNSITFEIPISK